MIKSYKNFLIERSKQSDGQSEWVDQTESNVREICKMYGIENWSINSEGLVDVDGSVYLYDEGLTKLPLKFGKVTGEFNCSRNQLTSLEGCPKEVGGFFSCFNNKLTNLIGGPEVVIGSYYADDNQIVSFEGFPDDYEGEAYFTGNPVQEILNEFPRRLSIKAIHLINDYDAIWNGEVIPERLEMVKEKLGLL